MIKPYIGIPIGDPNGIGPEIVVKALHEASVYSICNPVVIGNYDVLSSAIKICELNGELEINQIKEPDEGKFYEGIIDLVNIENVDVSDLKCGVIQAEAGKAAFDYICKCTELCLEGKLDAMATAPINKEAIKAAGLPAVAHTELLGMLCRVDDPLTMFEVSNMRVFFLSRHVSLIEACKLVTKERVLNYIVRCCDALKELGVDGGTLAVAALNPHSSDHGMFGDEELNEIIPAVNEAKEKGYCVEGPIAADSVFYQALQGKYSAVLSMYHDQGHIATKTLDFEQTISITLGLPFLRTSVDHGTAFDIAGTGKASSVSMEEAIHIAAKYAFNNIEKD